jgi:acetolactate synthase-1/2/3 large subunit
MIRHGQRVRYGSENVIGAELGPTRYDLVAAGFGAHPEFVCRAAELAPAIERAFTAGRPACINVLTDPDQPHMTSVAMAGARLEEGEVDLPYYGRKKLAAGV